MDKKALRSKSKTLTTNMQIGKNGLTPSVVAEIKTRLKKYKMLKIKMLKSIAEIVDKKEMGKDLATQTDSVLIDHIGSVYVLADKSVVDE